MLTPSNPPASFHLPIHLGTPFEGGTRSYEGRREARQGRHGRRGREHGRRRGTREERRIRRANRRRNRPFHLYAARIQLTLHLLPSFFFSSREPACLCPLPYTGCSSGRACIRRAPPKIFIARSPTHLCLGEMSHWRSVRCLTFTGCRGPFAGNTIVEHYSSWTIHTWTFL